MNTTCSYVTYSIILLLITVHLYAYFDNSLSYRVNEVQNVFLQHLISSFLHSNLLHLFKNCMSLYNLRVHEYMTGRFKYMTQILYLLFVNSLLWFFISQFFNLANAVGFTGVIFGLLTLYPISVVDGHVINPTYYPFIMLLITQLVVPNASFVGHLVGILSAHIYNII